MANKNEQEEREKHVFNEGRQSADGKWIKAIDERIEELEIQVGIPELRRLKNNTKYKWKD